MLAQDSEISKFDTNVLAETLRSDVNVLPGQFEAVETTMEQSNDFYF